MIRCGYCKKPFEQTAPEQRYCRRNHSLAARRLRARRRAAEARHALATGQPLCPRADKKSFGSPQQASHSWEHTQPTLVLYRCRCGGLHYGHRYGAYQVRTTQ